MAVVSSQLQERPPVEYFIRHVEALSGGNITIRAAYNWKSPQPNAEQQVVKATAAGAANQGADLGIVGTRVFDTMGVRSLQALTAPMLIDSYPLENAVLRSDIAKRMLGAVARLNVTGLALIGGGLRKPVAVARPLLGPREWRGTTFGTYLSKAEEDAVRALGAKPLVAFSSLRSRYLSTGQLKGFEFGVLAYFVNSEWSQARFITANVNLWPQIDVLLANPAALAQLTSQQRAWLQQAARDAANRSAGMMAAAENRVIHTICTRGTRFAEASHANLAWLHHAFAPVYSQLEENRQNRSFISGIERIKRATPAGAPLIIPKGCRFR
jgi:TRAP-type C4-dicarboxylate transport system substrate-binding protein